MSEVRDVPKPPRLSGKVKPPVTLPQLAAPAADPVITPEPQGAETVATTAETLTNETVRNTNEATDKMQGAFAAAGDKAQGAFADIQGRARSAVEKSARFYEEMGELTKGNVEALIASSRAAAAAAEALGQDAAEYGKRSVEQATQSFKSIAAAKSPSELLQLQNDFARSAFDAMVAESSRASEKMMKLVGEVVQPLSSRFAVAAEKVRGTSL